MENNSIREFTCNDCQEVTKVDWSKVRPDIDDGTSNIEIHEKGNGYAYYGECMNCGNLVEIEPPAPELVVDNVDVDKDGMYIQLIDTVTNRSCWVEAWQDENGDWEYDFNQYIFHLDNDNDIVAKMFQEDLGNYAEEVFDCVMGAIDDHEEEYNKLQESKVPTMRDRLKEAKRNRCEHKKTEVLDEKNQEAGVCPVCGNTDLDYGDTIMEQVGDYYGYNWKCSKCNHTGTEWYYMAFVDVYNTNTGEESHQEGICPDCGSDLMYDNFVPDGMDGYYEVYCDNCGFTGKEDYNLDFTDHTVNEEINESKEVKTETLHADQKEKLDNGTTRIKLVDDGHEQWFIVKAVKDNGVIDYDYDHNVEQSDEDRDYFDSSVDVNDVEEILLKTMKECKEVKTEAKSNTYTYQGYTFTPVGNVKSNVNSHNLLRHNEKLNKIFNRDEGKYNYDEFYKVMPSNDVFEIKELDNIRVIPASNYLFQFTGDNNTLTLLDDIVSDEELRQPDENGYIGTEEDKEIIDDLLSDMDYGDISSKYGWHMNEYQLYNIATFIQSGKADDTIKQKIDSMFEDMNYHGEFSDMVADIDKYKASLFECDTITEGLKVKKTENILDDVREYDAKLYDDVTKVLTHYFDDLGTPEDDVSKVITDIQSKFAFDHDEAVDIVNTFIKEYKTKLAGAEKSDMSVEDIKNLLDNGNIVKVGGKVGSTPSKFLEKDGKLYFQNAEISGNKFLLHPSSLDEMVDYIFNLQKDGYTITSQDWDDTVKIDESKNVKSEAPSDKYFEGEYVFVLQGKYENGWEDLVIEDTGKEIRQRQKEYDENEPDIPHRVRTRKKKESVEVKMENKQDKLADKVLEFLVSNNGSATVEEIADKLIPADENGNKNLDQLLSIIERFEGNRLEVINADDVLDVEVCLVLDDGVNEDVKGKKELADKVFNESKTMKKENAPADVIEYFGMQDNTDEEYKNNVAKEYKKLRAKYPDKEMILNGDFGTYLGTEKATPVEKGEYITVYENKKVTESKTSDMDTVAIIMELEGGELTIADVDDWNKVKEVANSLKGSQGFYGRLLRDMLESEEEFGGAENLPFPITM